MQALNIHFRKGQLQLSKQPISAVRAVRTDGKWVGQLTERFPGWAQSAAGN